jgi:hypothetical protein
MPLWKWEEIQALPRCDVITERRAQLPSISTTCTKPVPMTPSGLRESC